MSLTPGASSVAFTDITVPIISRVIGIKNENIFFGFLFIASNCLVNIALNCKANE